MAKLVSIDTLAGTFESAEDLQEYCDKQYLTIQKLTQDNITLNNEVKHLKELLASTTQLVGPDPVKIEVTPEQAICEIQIKFLHDIGKDRALTIEEVKRLESLVKSLYLIKEQGGAAIQSEFTRLPFGASIEALAQIAASPEKPEGQ